MNQFMGRIMNGKKCGQWKVAATSLRKLISYNIVPNNFCFNVAIEACFDSKEYSEAIDLVRLGRTLGHFPKGHYTNSGFVRNWKEWEWDFHFFTLPEACRLLSDALIATVRRGYASLPSAQDIVVITGKGRQSGSVLKTKLPKFLEENQGPEITVVKENVGWFLITKESLVQWEKSANFTPFIRLHSEGHCPGKGNLTNFVRNFKEWELDLHSYTLPVACMLLSDALISIIRRGYASQPYAEDIVVITGKGQNSGANGPVLKSHVPKFLEESQGPEITVMEGNKGYFLITLKSLASWEKSTHFTSFESLFISKALVPSLVAEEVPAQRRPRKLRWKATHKVT